MGQSGSCTKLACDAGPCEASKPHSSCSKEAPVSYGNADEHAPEKATLLDSNDESTEAPVYEDLPQEDAELSNVQGSSTSSMDTVDPDDFDVYAHTLAERLSRGHDNAKQVILRFFTESHDLQLDVEKRSKLRPIICRESSDVAERIVVEIVLRRIEQGIRVWSNSSCKRLVGVEAAEAIAEQALRVDSRIIEVKDEAPSKAEKQRAEPYPSPTNDSHRREEDTRPPQEDPPQRQQEAEADPENGDRCTDSLTPMDVEEKTASSSPSAKRSGCFCCRKRTAK